MLLIYKQVFLYLGKTHVSVLQQPPQKDKEETHPGLMWGDPDPVNAEANTIVGLELTFTLFIKHLKIQITCAKPILLKQTQIITLPENNPCFKIEDACPLATNPTADDPDKKLTQTEGSRAHHTAGTPELFPATFLLLGGILLWFVLIFFFSLK